MNQLEFRSFLKKSNRKASAIEQILGFVEAFEIFLQTHYPGKAIDQATDEVVESYVSWLECETGESASKPLWALRYYFDFNENSELSDLAGELRAGRIKRKPFRIANFRGVDLECIDKLESRLIENTDQMLEAGRTPGLRQELSEKLEIPVATILEFVKLCDLARLGGVRGVRARLYHDAGLIPEIIASWEPEDLQTMLVEWVEKNYFDGIPPTPKEVEHLIQDARKLPKLVIYE